MMRTLSRTPRPPPPPPLLVRMHLPRQLGFEFPNGQLS